MKQSIVIVGAGYAGTLAAKKLAHSFYDDKDISITLIDRHCFQTMRNQLFEVVCGRVGEESICVNLKEVFKGTKVKLVRDEVENIDFDAKTVSGRKGNYSYDKLVIATGSKPTYFGIPGAKEFSKPLWSYEDAVALREHIKMQFCKAKLEADKSARKKLLTFFVVGAGFTGVELTGELAEWIPSLCTAYSIPLNEVKIIECDMMDRVVMDFPRRLSQKIQNRLENMGVELMLKTSVKELTDGAIRIDTDGRERSIPTDTVIWAAGVEGSELMENVTDCQIAGRYRIKVNEYMQAVGLRDVYVGGDNVFFTLEDQKPTPQVVENAKQTAKLIAHNIEVSITGKGERKKYEPSFHGFMVSLGGRYGVANVGVNDTRVPLPPFLSQAAKHFSNIAWMVSTAGVLRVCDYIEDEFFEVPDRRSFLSIRFRQPWKR